MQWKEIQHYQKDNASHGQALREHCLLSGRTAYQVYKECGGKGSMLC